MKKYLIFIATCWAGNVQAQLYIPSGQSIYIDSVAKIGIASDMVNDGSFTGKGNVVLCGYTSQALSGNGTIPNLEMKNTNGASIVPGAANKVNVTGLLTLTEGVIASNGNLVLKSTSPTATAMVAPVVPGAGVSGNVIHERYLSAPANGSGGRSWRMMTTPLKGSVNNSIYYNWQNNGVNDGTGLEIWGPGGSNGLAPGPAYSMRKYNHITDAYTNVTNPQTESLFDANINKAFLVFISGHYGSGNVATGASATNSDAMGELITGTQTYNFTPPSAAKKYYMVGNPYACPIDFDKVYLNTGTTNLNRMFWITDPSLSATGAYVTVTYNSASGTYITSAGQQDKYIQTGQAIFVEGNSPGNQSTFVIQEDDKEIHAAQTPMFRTNNGVLETFRMKLYKHFNNTPTLLDGCVVACHQNSSNVLDGEDGSKFGNINENVSIYKGGNTWLAVESRQLFDQNDTIHLTVSNMQQTSYELEFEPGNMNGAGLNAVLIDNFTNTTTPISLNGNTTYQFSVTNNSASAGNNRLKIVFNLTNPLSLKFVNLNAEKKEKDVAVNWEVNNQEGIHFYEIERSTDGREFTRIASVNAHKDNVYSTLDHEPYLGNNYYRIKAVARSTYGIYSNVVRVNMNKGAGAELSVYPNPVKDGNLHISISNLAKGTYYLNLFNNIGQKVASLPLSHEGGSAVMSMDIAHLAAGIYILQCIGENGESIADHKIIRQ